MSKQQAAFEDGLVEYIEGINLAELESKRPDVYRHINHILGYRHFRFVLDAFCEFIITGRIPAETEIGNREVLREEYQNNYRKFVSKWKKFFSELYLDEEDSNAVKMRYVRLPGKIADRITSKITLGSLIELYRKHPEKRHDFDYIFAKIPAKEIHFYCSRFSDPERNAEKTNRFASLETVLEDAVCRAQRAEEEKAKKQSNQKSLTSSNFFLSSL
jgi:hypothetical protein